MTVVPSARLSELSRAEAGERGRAGAVCLLPVGSLEQHGDHLPVGTDSLLAETVALRAAGLARRDVVVAPTIWTGLSPHHVRLGVTVTLEPELLVELVRSVVGSLRSWFSRVVIVNGHGGNRGWLADPTLVEECPVVTYWELVEPALLRDLFPVDLGSIGHAGQAETSAMLAAAPGLVLPGPDRPSSRSCGRTTPSSCPTWASAACSAIPLRVSRGRRSVPRGRRLRAGGAHRCPRRRL